MSVHSDALAKRKDFNIEAAVQQSLAKDHKSTHDCIQVQELRAEIDRIKVRSSPYQPTCLTFLLLLLLLKQLFSPSLTLSTCIQQAQHQQLLRQKTVQIETLRRDLKQVQDRLGAAEASALAKAVAT